MFFWQASQEAEESRLSHRHKFGRRLAPGEDYFAHLSIDTWIGMSVSVFIAFFLMVTTAATLNAHGTTKIETAAQAAEALRPIAGELTFAAICGRHHRHLTSGSANSRRVGGLCRCRVLRVARKPRIAGRSSTWLLRDRRRGHTRRRRTCRHEYRPYRHAFWTAAINGVVAVPIMLAMMLIVSGPKATALPRWLKTLGWLATALMTLAVGLLFWSSLS